MLTREAREAKAQQWLERLEAWRTQEGTQSLAQFARSHGWKDFDAYRWQRILRRQGRWEARSAEQLATPVSPRKFVKVRVASAAPLRPLVFRLRLSNGRSGELELRDAQDLQDVVTALERT